ncbi:ATP-binding cassette domain-containing protein [Devosia sp. 2618]|uniref:ABC transporter ATP-binding protein n=1 Tax=Devosia sp. 2618 TaxID=3156454 RepID=UPI003399122C
MPGLSLAVSGLRLALAGVDVIDLPALAIAPGSLTVLSGASGSGKSTLLYLLSGLLRPDAGTIIWAETDIAKLGERQRDSWRRKQAGFIFQNFHLIEEMSPVDNVLVPVWLDRFSAASKRQRAMGLLHQLEVPTERDSVAKLSRGQQQRVAIARALIGDPSIIFADEPTASLDTAAGETVAAILQRLAHDEGRTVLVATHDPALKTLADQSLLLDHGRREKSA